MTAFELYEAAFDSACDNAEATTGYVVQYADGALDVTVSEQVAEQIISCHNNFTNNGSGTNDYFHMVEKPLSDIEI